MTPAAMDELGLIGIVPRDLPGTLGTPAESDRYTVSVQFTRFPSEREVLAIESSFTQGRLVRSGYPTIALSVVGRHLDVASTDLGELQDGLAEVLATVVRDVSVEAARQDADRLRLQRTEEERERTRAAAVTERAIGIRFLPAPAAITPLRVSHG